MVTKKVSKTAEDTRQPELTCSVAEAEQKLQTRIEKGGELRSTEFNSMQTYEAVKNEFYKWDAFNTELLKRLFTTAKLAEEYSYWGIGVITRYERSSAEKIRELIDDIDKKIHRLESIKERLELFPAPTNSTAKMTGSVGGQLAAPAKTAMPPSSKKVFIVHGRDEASKHELQGFLRHIGLEPVILHQQADQGMTVIEKFETVAVDVGYVFVLMTPDEIAYLASEESKPDGERKKEWRARPNVILEFGYFVGKLGRNRVCCLLKGNVSMPSDIHGLVYKSFNHSVEEAGISIIRDLRAAGYKDVNL